MTAVQMEFNIDNKTDTELQLSLMQKQIDAACESMGKVRRKLFSQMTELKKEMAEIKLENEALKLKLGELTNEKAEWVYNKEGYLFDVREHQEACG